MKLINEIFIGSLTGKTEKEQKKVLDDFRENNRRDKIKISILPNLVSKEFLKMLKPYNVSTVELEVQSTNGYILKKCRIFTYIRGYKESYKNGKMEWI